MFSSRFTEGKKPRNKYRLDRWLLASFLTKIETFLDLLLKPSNRAKVSIKFKGDIFTDGLESN